MISNDNIAPLGYAHISRGVHLNTKLSPNLRMIIAAITNIYI